MKPPCTRRSEASSNPIQAAKLTLVRQTPGTGQTTAVLTIAYVWFSTEGLIRYLSQSTLRFVSSVILPLLRPPDPALLMAKTPVITMPCPNTCLDQASVHAFHSGTHSKFQVPNFAGERHLERDGHDEAPADSLRSFLHGTRQSLASYSAYNLHASLAILSSTSISTSSFPAEFQITSCKMHWEGTSTPG